MSSTLGSLRLQGLFSTTSTRLQGLRHWALALILVLIAWQLGSLIWLMSEPEQRVATWQPPRTTSNTSVQSTSKAGEVIAANLFGEYQSVIVEDAPQVVDAPKTQLNLVLVGVVASSDPQKSLAVISNRNVQETLGVDELISGTRAKVVTVLPDRIIINNAGRDETLLLEGIEVDHSSSASVSQPTTTRAQSNVIGNNSRLAGLGDLASIKQAILDDPQQFLKYIRLSQVNQDGQLLGYRVRPGRERALFDSVGLENGDLAVELNGVDLTDKTAMASIMQEFDSMTEVNLVVERDGQRYDIYIQF